MKIYNTSEPIVNHYITLINAGKKTIKEVPERFQEEIAGLLNISLKDLTLEEEQEKKIVELSKACENLIYTGTDVTLPSDDVTRHYSFTLTDQTNIRTCFELAVSSQQEVPYHADDEGCRLYSVEDIITIYAEEQYFITEKTTYFNWLKQQVKSLEDIETVKAVTMSTPLTGEFKEEYDKIVAYAEETKNNIKESYLSRSKNVNEE